MLDLAEILSAQPKQRGAVEFRVAADVVVRVRVQLFAVFVLPLFFRLILAFDVDRAAVPVVLLAVHVVAAFEQKNAFAGRSQLVGERAATRAGPDDDHIVLSCRFHGRSPDCSLQTQLRFFRRIILNKPKGRSQTMNSNSWRNHNERYSAGRSDDGAWHRSQLWRLAAVHTIQRPAASQEAAP